MPNEVIKPGPETPRSLEEGDLFEQVVSEPVHETAGQDGSVEAQREDEASVEETRRLLQFKKTNRQIPTHPLPTKIEGEKAKRAEVAKLISATGEGYDMAAFLESNFEPDSTGKVDQVDDHLDQAA